MTESKLNKPPNTRSGSMPTNTGFMELRAAKLQNVIWIMLIIYIAMNSPVLKKRQAARNARPATTIIQLYTAVPLPKSYS